MRVFIVIGGICLLSTGIYRYINQARQLSRYLHENEQLKKENETLVETLKRSTHPFDVEKTARNQLRMMKPGEYRIEFEDKKSVPR